MTPRQPTNRKPSSGKHVPPPVTLPKAPWAQEDDDMTHARHQVEHSRNRAGKLRKEIVAALEAEIQAWLDGRPGDLCMGALYERFFRGQG